MYEVMARRYRPALFEQVVGQEHIAATLKNAITRDRVAHAYMFTGGHGCGKTTMARILAKALVCRHGPTPAPCCVCPICVDVAAGRDADVLEIDGASNNGIEQIRQLREQAAYVPTRARCKIYIIDEVHMLSDGAFNALLKTLEEPPRHVKFILATTDPHKVPDTILSRCQRFDFRLVPQKALSEFFRKLAGEEKTEISDEALDAVAAFAEGSVRDGLVLLDQLLSFADGRVERADVEAVRGVASAENVAGIFDAVAGGDARRALAVVDEVASRGTNVGDFLDQLISFGRDVMLTAAGAPEDTVSAYGPAKERLETLAKTTGLEAALMHLDVLAAARTRVRTRALSNPLVVLEMAVARLAGLGGVTPVKDILEKLSQMPMGNAAAPAVSAPVQPVPAPAPKPVAVPPPPPAPPKRPAPPPSVPFIPDEPAYEDFEPDMIDVSGESAPKPVHQEMRQEARKETPASTAFTTAFVKENWSRILDELAEKHPADFRHMLRIDFECVRDGTIVLSGSPTAVEAWEDRHRRARLGQAAAAVLGGEAEFAFEQKASRRLAARKAAAVANEVTDALVRHPAVDAVRSLFDGVVVHCEAATVAAPNPEHDTSPDE